MKLRGTIPFDSRSEDMGFREVLRPGAFDRTLADSKHDVIVRPEHDSRLLLARRSSGTLRLSADRSALRYDFDVPDTSAGRDVSALVERGDLTQSSFAFSVPDPERGERWSILPDGTLLRELLDVDLIDVAPVAMPAYLETTLGTREREPTPGVPLEVLRARNDLAMR